MKWILLMIGGLFSLDTLAPAQDVAAPDMPNVDMETKAGQQFVQHREAMCKVILLLLVERVIDSFEKGQAKMNELDTMKSSRKSFPSDDLLAACPEEFRKLYYRQNTIVEGLIKEGISWRENEELCEIKKKIRSFDAVYGMNQPVSSFFGRMNSETTVLDNDLAKVAYLKKLRERLKTEKLMIPDRVDASGDQTSETKEGTWFAEAEE